MTRLTRRVSVAAVATATAGLLLVGCGGSDKSSTDTSTSAASSGGSGTTAAQGGGGSTTTDTQATAPANATVIGVKVGETDAKHMYLTPDKLTAPAGPVSFEVVNEGVKEHEFVVLKTDTKAANLAYVAADDKAVENEADAVDEIGSILAGDSATLNLNLEAGHYVLLCNIKGHYKMGMVSDFTVT
jgi:uncharacterized cupredoxin-like copper-binding protein